MSTSKARISSTSSPNHSARQGRPRSRPKTSTIPPAHRHLPGRGHRGHPPVAEADQAPEDGVPADALAPGQLAGGVEGRDREGGAEQPGRGRDHQGRLAVAEQGEGGDPAAGHLLGRWDPVEAGGVRRRPEARGGPLRPRGGRRRRRSRDRWRSPGRGRAACRRAHQATSPTADAGMPPRARSEPSARARRGATRVEAGGQRGGAGGRRLNHRVRRPPPPPDRAGAGGCTRSWPAPGRRARSQVTASAARPRIAGSASRSAGVKRVEDVVDGVLALGGPADPDPDPDEVGGLPATR